VVYVIWLAVTFGTIGREGFTPVLEAGGNTGDLVRALANVDGDLGHIKVRMTWFSHCAIVTSFLSVGLGLFHFIQDKLKFTDSLIQRSKAVVVCFLPPAIASFFYPKGFLLAIGYAGLFVTFSFFIVPALMTLKRLKQVDLKQVSEFKSSAMLVIVFGLSMAVLKLSGLLGLLP